MSFWKLYHLGLDRALFLLIDDTLADGAVETGGFAFFGVKKLLVLGVDERVLAFLANLNFVGHKGLIY
jgi:hypothetical protein